MDLKEMRDAPVLRHPWETARVMALAKVLGGSLREGMRILDVGCGDGYVCRTLFSRLVKKGITAVDINLTGERLRQLQRQTEEITYLTRLPPKGSRFDLTLLLDVVEHVENDRHFLADIVRRHVPRGGRVMVTVPAFASLYSSHDLFLGHYRRYRLAGVDDLARAAGLQVVASGYLFGSLLLPKLLLYKILHWSKSSDGIGCWNSGPIVTAIVEKLLHMDNCLMIAAADIGIKLPGLTVWVLCEKPLLLQPSTCADPGSNAAAGGRQRLAPSHLPAAPTAGTGRRRHR